MKRVVLFLAAVAVACTPAAPSSASPTAEASPTPPVASTPGVAATTSAAPATATQTTLPSPSPTDQPALLAIAPLGKLSGQIAWVLNVPPQNIQFRSIATLELWAMPLDGSRPRLAVRYPTRQFALTGIDTNALRRQFSPDGRRIVLSVATGANGDRHGLVIVDLEAGRVVSTLGGPDEQDVNPVWSPDGTKIAFVRPALLGLSAEIWVATADLTGARRLRAGGNGTGTLLYGWTKDSTRVGFAPIYFERSSFALLDMNGVVSAETDASISPNSTDPVDWRAKSPAFAMSFQDPSPQPTHATVAVGDDPSKAARTIAEAVWDPTGSTYRSIRDPRWDPSGSDRLVYVQVGVEDSFVLADITARTTKEFSSRVRKAEWLPDGSGIVTLEEHPSTAPLSVYVWNVDGTLRTGGIFLPQTDTTYRLIDLAPRAY